jgi:hypothetical protein
MSIVLTNSAAFVIYCIASFMACWQIGEVLHHGSIFGWLRKRASNWLKSRHAAVRCLGDLVSCPFCLSHWIAGVVVITALVGIFHWWVALPIWIFACARASNLANDLTHAWCRSPMREDNACEDDIVPPDNIKPTTYYAPDFVEDDVAEQMSEL